MAKINISFNNKNFSIDENALAVATTLLKDHFTTELKGSGAVIRLDEVNYNIDSTKLNRAENDFITHLSTISGDGYKVIVRDNEYSISSNKIQDSITKLEEILSNFDDSVDMLSDIYDKAFFAEVEALGGPALFIARENGQFLILLGALSLAPVFCTYTKNGRDISVNIPNLGVVTATYAEDGQSLYCYELQTSALLNTEFTNNINVIFDGNCYYLLDNQNTFGVVFAADKTKTNYQIKSYVNGCPIRNIGYAAFSDTNIEHIEIPSTINEIGVGAFQNCKYLNNIEIPESVTEIGEGAFAKTGLKLIVIPETVQYFSGMYIFDKCYDLEVATIRANQVPMGCFRDCSKLHTLNLGVNIQYIQEGALENCTSLISINYAGTTDQWNAIEKATAWNFYIPATYVQCSNGQVTL